ncbi:MAG: RIP metalloprotease RseP [Bacilli bacterium]|jgi:regulator of sigma E protease
MTLVYFILILGVTVLVHELGHFLFAKRAGIYVYEFSIGMGPKLFGFKRKNDETSYSIRLIPLGGYVQMAGEEIEPDVNIPENKRMQSKTWLQRFLTIVAGCLFNFLFAFLLLLMIGLIYGAPEQKPYIGKVIDDYPAASSGMEIGDLILSVNGQTVKTSDDVMLQLELADDGDSSIFKVQKMNGDIKTYTISPQKETEAGKDTYVFGMSFTDKVNYGVDKALEFAVVKFGSIFKTMFEVVLNLVTGKLGLQNMAGPVGIYNIVGEEAQAGLENILYLIAFLSINVGFINFLPIPAFDGGRLLFLIIEKIKGSKVNAKVENIIHAIGFGLLIILMILITIQDIIKLL